MCGSDSESPEYPLSKKTGHFLYRAVVKLLHNWIGAQETFSFVGGFLGVSFVLFV